jgi:hypothetical protein
MKFLFLLLAFLPTITRAVDTGLAWQPATWNGERSLVSVSGGWKAIVSLERSRLIYFGPDGRETNLLLAPPTRANRNIFGGHRLWLGPQSTWSKIWPPPEAWEYRAPDSFVQDDGVLKLSMPDAGDGWPRLTRTYRWESGKLVCGAELAGGSRPAQIIQIFQVPVTTIVLADAHPEKEFPGGYVELPSGAGPFAANFSPPTHVTRQGDALSLHHTEAIAKLGFRPQTLASRQGDFVLRVERGGCDGTLAGEPDRGFFTQVYLGGREPLIELEQLSPLFAAGQPARFEVALQALFAGD